MEAAVRSSVCCWDTNNYANCILWMQNAEKAKTDLSNRKGVKHYIKPKVAKRLNKAKIPKILAKRQKRLDISNEMLTRRKC